MRRIPNFTATLLQKKGYGLDIDGQVHDNDGQTYLKDLRYTNTPPNEQQYQEGPDLETLDPAAKLYYGTTLNLWKTETPQSLHLTSDLKSAEIEARNAAESASYDDLHKETPIVVMIRFGDLNGYNLKPDVVHAEVHEGASWQKSLRDTGAFCVSGDLKALKPKFKLTSG